MHSFFFRFQHGRISPCRVRGLPPRPRLSCWPLRAARGGPQRHHRRSKLAACSDAWLVRANRAARRRLEGGRRGRGVGADTNTPPAGWWAGAAGVLPPRLFFFFVFCICAARLLSQRGLPTDTLPPSGSQSHLPNSAPRLIAQAASARCGPHIFFEYPHFHDHGQPDDAHPARMRQPLSTHSAPQKHRTKTVAGWPATRPTAAPGRYQGPRLSGGSVHRSWGWRRCAGLCRVQHIRTVLHVQYIVPIRSTRHKHVKKKAHVPCTREISDND